jgi:mannose-6-phosphate isomerase-like protein (cupin superfamily)
VLKVGDHFEDPRTGAMLEVTAWPQVAGAGVVQVLRLHRPGMGFRVPHIHLAVDESFEVKYGIGDFWVGHRTFRVGPGEEFRIPRYEIHVGPRNRSTTDLVFLQTLSAARTDAAQRYVETLAQFIEEGREVHGDLPPIVAAAVFAGSDQQTYAPWVPRPLQHRVLFPLARSFEEWRDDRRRQGSVAVTHDYSFWTEERANWWRRAVSDPIARATRPETNGQLDSRRAPRW